MKEQIIENVTVVDTADKGYSIGKDTDGRVYMVDHLIPGDVADIQIYRKRKGIQYGTPVQIKTNSPYRQMPFCPHFGVCGGCKWQHMSYEGQLKYKELNVINAMKRIGKLTIPEIRPILGVDHDRHYRNKMEYSFSNRRWLTEAEIASGDDIEEFRAIGLHRPGSFDKVVDINICYLQDDFANEIRNSVRQFTLINNYTYFDLKQQKGLLRNLIIRNTTLGEWMVVIVFSREDKKKISNLMEHLQKTFPSLSSLQYIINEKKNDTIYDLDVVPYYGKDHIVEQLGEVKYKISVKSFFQTNSRQAEHLYNRVSEFANLSGKEVVYDLYTGTGSIALYLAFKAKHIVGIEEIEAAVMDAVENMHLNQITNTEFYTGDVKEVLSPEFAKKHGKPDVVITDPPRAGMHEKVIETLKGLRAPRIVYVSCNPSTQARDCQLLSEFYEIKVIQPVDMFPHTHHIENIALLELKQST